MRVILFDLDDTLITTGSTNTEIYKGVQKELGITKKANDFKQIVKSIFRKNMLKTMDYEKNESIGIDPLDYYMLEKPYRYGDIEKFKELNYNDLKKEFSKMDREELDQAFYRRRHSYKDTVVGMLEILTYLKDFAKLGLVTNGITEMQELKIEASGLRPYLDYIFISEEFGYGKPDPRFYKHIIEKTEADLATSFMIGDNIQADYFGSQAAGLNSIFFSDAKVRYKVNRATNAKEVLDIIRPSLF